MFRRFLGIDYGSKRIGIAIGDDGDNIASPVKTVEAHGNIDDDVNAVLVVAGEFDHDAFVVGLPLNMDDTEGKQAKLTRKFGASLQRAGGKPVHFFDERLSSHAAGELLAPAEFTHKKRKTRLDAVAAQIILQGFLDAQTRG